MPSTLDTAGIIARIRYLIDSSNMSQARFAQRIGLDPSNLSKQLSGRLPVTEGLVNRIVADMGVNKNWLRDGVDTPYTKSQFDVVETLPVATADSPQIPVYDIDVCAGATPLWRSLTDDRIIGFISMPNIRPGSVIVRVNGDSMEPVIKNGAYIVMHRVTQSRIINWGNIYVVVLEEFRVVKYLRKDLDHPGGIILHSANPAYDDIDITRDDIQELFYVDQIINFDLR